MTDFAITGMGNAIVDMVFFADDNALLKYNLTRSSMSLIDETQAMTMITELTTSFGNPELSAGGSVANSIVVASALRPAMGAKLAYIGALATDDAGKYFYDDLQKNDVFYAGKMNPKHTPPTAVSIIIVTPDGERTMCTCLGMAKSLDTDYVDDKLITNSHIFFAEAYLWSEKSTRAALLKAMKSAGNSDCSVALTLSDAGYAARYRDEFIELIKNKTVNITIANDLEAKALYDTSDLDQALKFFAEDCSHGLVTLGADGAAIAEAGEIIMVPAYPVDKVKDLTGAGDAFAAAYLYGNFIGLDKKRSAELGAFVAAAIITKPGARPDQSLHEAVVKQGFLIT